MTRPWRRWRSPWTAHLPQGTTNVSSSVTAGPWANVHSPLTSSIVTIVVGHERRIFAAHEDVLSRSAYFASVFKDQFLEPNGKKVDLVDEYVFVC